MVDNLFGWLVVCYWRFVTKFHGNTSAYEEERKNILSILGRLNDTNIKTLIL